MPFVVAYNIKKNVITIPRRPAIGGMPGAK